MSCVLMWFRNDLRIHDNTALAAAARQGQVVAVFLRSLPQWQGYGHGPNKLEFWGRGVSALRDDLAGLNIPLLHRDIEAYDHAPATLLAIARETGAKALHFNREYPLDEQRRDQAVATTFARAGLTAVAHHDATTFAPGELLTGNGDYFRVFTPFAKAWHRELSAERLAPRDTPSPQSLPAIAPDPLPPTSHDGERPVSTDDWPAGAEPAADRLERFLRFRGRHYARQRDVPAFHGTSELSPYLALGMISHRQCLQAVLGENHGQLAEGDVGLVTWVNELVWREFYQHVAAGFPRVCQHRAFQQHTEALAWRSDEVGFRAWCEGRTGYPIVDAGMRQLVQTGWMHNRLRMITAMFLSKHLLIDWRHGEAFFLHQLFHPLQACEGGMTFIHMANFGLNAQGIEGFYTTYAKQDFLFQSVLPIATIQLMRNAAVAFLVFFQIGIEQVQGHATNLNFPDFGMQRTAGELNVDFNPVAILVFHRKYRQVAEFLWLVVGHLFAMGR